MSSQPHRLHGRDERGFLLGSPMAQEAARLYARAEKGENPTESSPDAPRPRRGGWPVMPPEQAILEPAWSLGLELADQGKRFRDREKARAAAAQLGVQVPDWARPGRRTITQDHRENIRAASLRRFRREREGR